LRKANSLLSERGLGEKEGKKHMGGGFLRQVKSPEKRVKRYQRGGKGDFFCCRRKKKKRPSRTDEEER